MMHVWQKFRIVQYEPSQMTYVIIAIKRIYIIKNEIKMSMVIFFAE